MGEILVPLLESIGGYIVKFVMDEAGKLVYQIFVDEDGDGEADTPDEPFFTVPYDDFNDTDVIVDTSPDEVLLTDENRIDTSEGIYGSLCQIIAVPKTRDQENILLIGALTLLILGCTAVFKIVNYLFHI